MGFFCGIVGLPNVGKSTLFNALTASAAAEAANYPFTTIEPNVGRIAVPDERLARIATLAQSQKITPTHIDFVDIAGLVAGASAGEGLGNRFLGHIREVDAIAHVLRCFDDPGVVHVGGRVDPLADAAIVETELMLADLESLERRAVALDKRARGRDREAIETLAVAEKALAALRAGRPARSVTPTEAEAPAFARLQLLTAKPVLYVCNVGEAEAATGNAWSDSVAARAAAEGAFSVVVSARIEADLAPIADADERAEYLAAIGLAESGLARIIRAGYAALGLITFFTAGKKETRAWTIPAGSTARQAAGRIHTDFERGFIAAETIGYDDFIAYGGEQGARDAGKCRAEGRDYAVRDGDIMLFRFNV